VTHGPVVRSRPRRMPLALTPGSTLWRHQRWERITREKSSFPRAFSHTSGQMHDFRVILTVISTPEWSVTLSNKGGWIHPRWGSDRIVGQ